MSVFISILIIILLFIVFVIYCFIYNFLLLLSKIIGFIFKSVDLWFRVEIYGNDEIV